MSDTASDEELKLKIRKLQLEVEELSRKNSWQRRLGGFGHIGAVLLPYAALLFTIYQFSLQQEQTRQSLDRHTKAQEEATSRAFMAPILAKQADYYFSTITAAAQFVSRLPQTVRTSSRLVY